MSVRLNPAIRLVPPSDVTGDDWLADDLLDRRRYRVSRRAAAALVAACQAREPAELIASLAGGPPPSPEFERWEGIVARLTERGLIVDEESIASDPRLTWLLNLRWGWSRRGWHEAFEYHVLSFDYPCIDYSEASAFQLDQDLMRSYQSIEPDDDRFKLDYVGHPCVTLPKPSEQMRSGSARDVWLAPPPPANADFNKLAMILSLGFGMTGLMVPRTNSAPVLRRTSPSGGARHPSEGYAVIVNLPGAEPGWYHVTMQPFSLRLLDGRPTGDDELRRCFPETFERFPYEVRALIVITSRFERNMYRYREPRTFRTVHMDAGHIGGSLRIAARSLGLTAGIYLCDHATAFEDAIGIDGMAEGYMLTVAIADGAEQPSGREAGQAVGRADVHGRD